MHPLKIQKTPVRSSNKVFKLWMANLISFALLVLLSITGLVNWLILPRGFEAKGGFAVSLRHFFVEIHQWTALLFLAVVLVHILFHRGYIRTNLSKYRNANRKR